MSEGETCARSAQKLLVTRYHRQPRYLAKLVVVLPHVPMFASYEFCHPDLGEIVHAARYFGHPAEQRLKYVGKVSSFPAGQEQLNIAARMYAEGYLEHAGAFKTQDTPHDRETTSKAWGKLCKLARLTYCYVEGERIPEFGRKRMFKEAKSQQKLADNIEASLGQDALAQYTNRDLMTAIEKNVIRVPGVAPAILSRYFALLAWRYEDAERLRKESQETIRRCAQHRLEELVDAQLA